MHNLLARLPFTTKMFYVLAVFNVPIFFNLIRKSLQQSHTKRGIIATAKHLDLGHADMHDLCYLHCSHLINDYLYHRSKYSILVGSCVGMQVLYRAVSLVTSSESKQKICFMGDTLLSEKFFRGWRITLKIMKLNQPQKFLRIQYLLK